MFVPSKGFRFVKTIANFLNSRRVRTSIYRGPQIRLTIILGNYLCPPVGIGLFMQTARVCSALFLACALELAARENYAAGATVNETVVPGEAAEVVTRS